MCFPNTPKTVNCICVNTVFINKLNRMIYCLVFINERVKVVVKTVTVWKYHCFFLNVFFNQWLQSLSLRLTIHNTNLFVILSTAPKSKKPGLCTFPQLSFRFKFVLINFKSFSFSVKFNWGSFQRHRHDFSTEVNPDHQNSVGDKSMEKFFADIHRNFEVK